MGKTNAGDLEVLLGYLEMAELFVLHRTSPHASWHIINREGTEWIDESVWRCAAHALACECGRLGKKLEKTEQRTALLCFNVDELRVERGQPHESELMERPNR